MPLPRPILKPPPSPSLTSTSPLPFPSTRIPMLDSPCVHFPPTPTLAQIEITHSSFIYDRKPILVLPNACALPGRGERALDSLVDSEYDFEGRSLGGKKKRMKAGYFHPKAFDAVSCEDETDQLELSSSLLFVQDGSSLSHSSYRRRGEINIDRGSYPRFRSASPALALDSSESCSESSDGSVMESLTSDTVPCQFQSLPSMDFSLQKWKLEDAPSKKSNSRMRTCTTSNLERTRIAIGRASNVACGSFTSGFYDPGLEGCLGGF